MRDYQVYAGVAHIGPGQTLRISDEQFQPRAHNLEALGKDGKRHVVRSLTPLQFKVGETIGLPDLPKNLTDIVRPIGAATTPAEKVAAEKAAAAEKPTKSKASPKKKATAKKPPTKSKQKSGSPPALDKMMGGARTSQTDQPKA